MDSWLRFLLRLQTVCFHCFYATVSEDTRQSPKLYIELSIVCKLGPQYNCSLTIDDSARTKDDVVSLFLCYCPLDYQVEPTCMCIEISNVCKLDPHTGRLFWTICYVCSMLHVRCSLCQSASYTKVMYI